MSPGALPVVNDFNISEIVHRRMCTERGIAGLSSHSRGAQTLYLSGQQGAAAVGPWCRNALTLPHQFRSLRASRACTRAAFLALRPLYHRTYARFSRSPQPLFIGTSSRSKTRKDTISWEGQGAARTHCIPHGGVGDLQLSQVRRRASGWQVLRQR